MSREYGVFNDEGCLERGFYTEAAARAALERRYADEPGGYAAPLCPEHDEQPNDRCEECQHE
jgi:hypothetical protein